MVKFLNFCCFIAHLPKKLKVAVIWLFVVTLIGACVLATIASIEAAWQIQAIAWVICLATIALMYRQIHVKWYDGTFLADEYDNY